MLKYKHYLMGSCISGHHAARPMKAALVHPTDDDNLPQSIYASGEIPPSRKPRWSWWRQDGEQTALNTAQPGT